MVPADVSRTVIADFKILKEKRDYKVSKDKIIDTQNSFAVSRELDDAMRNQVGKKRTKDIADLYKIAHKNHADKMIANYIFSTKQSFKSCNSLAYTEMVKAITEAGPGYIPPKEKEDCCNF